MAKKQCDFPTSLDTLDTDRVAGQIVTSDSYDVIETAITEVEAFVWKLKSIHETFPDVRAANSSGIHLAIAGSTASEQNITTDITNPDVPRNTSITVTQNDNPSGDITIYGTFTDGTTGNEAIASTTGGTSYGNKAFAKVSSFTIPITISSGDTVSIGWSDKIGLCHSFNSCGDIFKMTKNALDTSSGISGNVDTTNHTLDCSSITEYDDIQIWYEI